MNKLIQKWSQAVQEALEDKKFTSSNAQDKSKTISLIDDIISAYNSNHYDMMILGLLALKAFVSDHISPEDCTLQFVDFLTDEGMYDWITEKTDQKTFSSTDLQAAKLIIDDLTELKTKNLLFL